VPSGSGLMSIIRRRGPSPAWRCCFGSGGVPCRRSRSMPCPCRKSAPSLDLTLSTGEMPWRQATLKYSSPSWVRMTGAQLVQKQMSSTTLPDCFNAVAKDGVLIARGSRSRIVFQERRRPPDPDFRLEVSRKASRPGLLSGVGKWRRRRLREHHTFREALDQPGVTIFAAGERSHF